VDVCGVGDRPGPEKGTSVLGTNHNDNSAEGGCIPAPQGWKDLHTFLATEPDSIPSSEPLSGSPLLKALSETCSYSLPAIMHNGEPGIAWVLGQVSFMPQLI
jgi:hypothetical protein